MTDEQTKERIEEIASWIQAVLIYFYPMLGAADIYVSQSVATIKFDSRENIAFKFDIDRVERVHIIGMVIIGVMR